MYLSLKIKDHVEFETANERLNGDGMVDMPRDKRLLYEPECHGYDYGGQDLWPNLV